MVRNLFRPEALLVLLLVAGAGACGGSSDNPSSDGPSSPSLVSIAVTPSSATLAPGGAGLRFFAKGTYSDGSTGDLTSSVTWTASDPAVAGIAGGLVTTAATGTVDIIASSGSVSGKALLAVTPDAYANANDAGGFLWGTEGNVNIADAANLAPLTASVRDAINGTLRTRYVKFRISRAFFSTSDGGLTFSPVYCLPSATNCHDPFNMDEVAKLYKANGWSMIPMLRTDETQTVTTALIDDYVNFVDWFVGRYKTDASIEMIELVNSPNPGTDAFSTWKGTLAQLVELSNKTYDRVKSGYPDVAVGTPGFEYWVDSTSGSDGAFIAVIEYFLDKNNGAKFDFWAFHGYALRARDPQGFMTGPYPPTMTPLQNKYANITGIREVRAALDANGWQDRKIIDTEHDNITAPGQPITAENDALDTAYVLQELTLKRTVTAPSGTAPALSGALPLKMAPRGTIGEAALSSLNADGTVPLHVKAMALLWSKLRDYPYLGHVNGAFDDETQAWVEKFGGGKKELYIFFKPFPYVSGQKIALDGQSLDYALDLGAMPSSVVLTDAEGAATTLAPSQTVTLKAENTPKFLEVTYP